MLPAVRMGDVFVVRGNMGVLSAGIRQHDKFYGPDNEGRYGHAGIIISDEGDTLEALWTVKRGHLEEYRGMEILIARPTYRLAGSAEKISEATKWAKIKQVESEFSGKFYPVWRLPLFFFPPLAKYAATGTNLVCSEFTAYYCFLLDARFKPWAGVFPGMLADEWRRWRNFDNYFEGVL